MSDLLQRPEILAAIAAVAFAAFAFFIAWLFRDIGEEFQQSDLGFVGVFALMLPLARKMGKLTDLVQSLPLGNYLKWAERNLNRSGLDDKFSPKEYVGSHIVLLIIGIALPLTLIVLLPNVDRNYVIMFSLFLGFILFFAPFYYLNQITKDRRWAIFCAMPYFLDLMTLLVEAGMEFTMAIDRASELMTKGPLQQEMKRFFKQLQLGRSRKKALLELADRSDLIEMRSFVTALIQQEELGTPLGKVMRMQGEIMRFRRIQVAEEKANKAPTQMLIPMILFIFPSIFLVLIGPMMIQAFHKVK
ncbi:type II secretion system F family protein [Candidatus Sumerlaeota bacterium]|nr:type II secretion system F family protein [Candidatus Sumerlaeota bacterium]